MQYLLMPQVDWFMFNDNVKLFYNLIIKQLHSLQIHV